jgi:sulfoxide reductase heme-binding subunit YedZ
MRNNLMAFLMLIRRQLGVLSFAFSFLHYSTIRLFPVLFGERELVLPLPVYELLGVGALYAMVPLFLTSNDLSVKKLKRWWHRIHAMIYFIVWLLFAHVALQGISPATVILFIFAFLEVFSLAYFAAKNYVKK